MRYEPKGNEEKNEIKITLLVEDSTDFSPMFQTAECMGEHAAVF